MNLWVCKLGGGLLGYAAFPGGAANVDGVVITYTAFGNTGTAAAPFDKGRTATHEIGHWLDLRHIWGDDCPSGDQCAGSDSVADTPNQECSNAGCPTFPKISCANDPDGDLFMNYMDYTDDACMFMFTSGQSVRMDAALDGARLPIQTSDAFDKSCPLDLIFCIDTTGSMWDDIAAVKVAATDIVNNIAAKVTDYRIALVDFRDCPVSPCGESSDYIYNVRIGWSNAPAAIVAAINTLGTNGGHDWPESVFAALVKAIKTEGLGGDWRQGVAKAIILIGDAPPHDPDCCTGETSADVVAAALAGDLASIFTIVIGEDTAAAAYFATLAAETGGKAFTAATAGDVVDAILEAINAALEDCTNGIDDDGDGLIDCADPDCEIDNDGGWILCLTVWK